MKIKVSELFYSLLSFLDPVTFEVICTFNQCVDKFTIEGSEVLEKQPKWAGGEVILHEMFYHECNECGRRVFAKGDRTKAYHSYLSGVMQKSANNNLINPEDPTQ